MADKLVETDVEKVKPLLARGKDGVRRGTIGGVKVSLGRSGKSNGGARLFRAGSKMTYLDKPYADGGNSGRNQTRRNIKSYLASLKKSTEPSALATLDSAIEKARGLLPKGGSRAMWNRMNPLLGEKVKRSSGGRILSRYLAGRRKGGLMARGTKVERRSSKPGAYK